MRPLLSVVMPLYNAAPHLDASIESIVAQSFRDLELVIVDDGSTDGSIDIARGWARRDRRVRVLENPTRLGVVENGNRAVQEARAPVCARMDADDVSHPDRLRAEWEVLRDHAGVVLVATLSDGIDVRGRTVRPCDRSLLTRRSVEAPFSHGSIVFRRDDFQDVGGYRQACDLWSDLELYYRLSERGRILVLPDVLYRHRFHLNSVSTLATLNALSYATAQMDRCLALRRAGKDYASTLQTEVPNGNGTRVPMTRKALYSVASRRLWAGHSPRIVRALAGARLPVDRTLVQAWVLALTGAVSPRGVRFFLRIAVRARDRAARRSVPNGTPVEWRFA